MIQEFHGALGPLEQALRLNIADRQAGIYLALTYPGLEQPEKAARQLRDTAKYSPQDVEISYHEGEAYLEGVRRSLALLREAGTNSALYHWALAIGAQQKNDKVSLSKSTSKPWLSLKAGEAKKQASYREGVQLSN